MYLFKDKDKIDVAIKCKLCFAEIKFTISQKDYENIEKFPLIKEEIHGEPPHKLIIFLNKYLEIENFNIEEIEREVIHSKDLTKEVLGAIGLSEDEIDLYFATTGRDILSIGEITLLSKKSKEDTLKIIEKFLEKGLFKEIVGITPHYKALAPYAALVNQLGDFNKFITDIKEVIPPQLEGSFSEIEKKTEGIKKLKEYNEFMIDLKETTLSQLDYQKALVESTLTEIENIRGISNVIAKLKTDTKGLMEEQINDISQQFDFVNDKLASSMREQIEKFRNQFTDLNKNINQRLRNQVKNLATTVQKMNDIMAESLEKMHLGAVKKTVITVVNSITKRWVDDITGELVVLTRDIERISNEGLNSTTKNLESQLERNKEVTDEGLERTTQNINTQMISKMDDSMKNTINDINEIISSTGNTGNEIKNVFTDITESFGSAVQMAGEKITEISDEITSSFNDLKTLFSEKVMNTLNDVLANILQKLEISETTTNEFWEQAKQVSLITMKDIWFIKSIEGAKAHTLDELPKTKMRLLIIAPQITDIDVDALKNECKSHVNIRIVAKINLTDPEHVAVLVELEKMTNVAFRHREMQNLWGVNRDYEEVIICVLSETEIGGVATTEIAGIGSQIEEHIKIFTPILEDAWIGATKDILKQTALKKPTSSRTSPTHAPPTTPTEPAQEPPAQPNIDTLSTPPPLTPTARREQKKASANLLDVFNNLKNGLEELTGEDVFESLTVLRDSVFETIGFSPFMREINAFSGPFKRISRQLEQSERDKIVEQLDFWMKKLNL